jgi:C1A family cysteine protease
MKVFGLLVVGVGANIDSWETWKLKFGRRYNGVSEEARRYGIFFANVEFMRASNARTDISYKLGTNQFSDMTNEEYNLGQCTCDMPRPSAGARHVASKVVSDIAPSLDWVSQGVVTPVKDQGACGSCWTFSDTGAMESAYALYHNQHVSLSEQQLVSCLNGPTGCNGGGIDSGFRYAESTPICTEATYSYLATNTECTLSDGCDIGLPAGTVTGHVDVEVGNEDALLSALNLQPVSVGVNASMPAFQHYHSGIVDDDACGTNHNHAILAVGYGTEDGKDYFRIKNSWGTSWGDAGFIRLARGKSGLGQCGVLSEPSYPVMASSMVV